MALLSESKMASSNELIRTSFAFEFSIVFLINPKFPKTVEDLTPGVVVNGASVTFAVVLDTALVVFDFLELFTVVTFRCAVVGGGVVVVVRIAFFDALLLIDFDFLELVLLLLSVLGGKGVVVVVVVVVVVALTVVRLFVVVVIGVNNAFNNDSRASSTVLFFPDLSLTNNKTNLL